MQCWTESCWYSILHVRRTQLYPYGPFQWGRDIRTNERYILCVCVRFLFSYVNCLLFFAPQSFITFSVQLRVTSRAPERQQDTILCKCLENTIFCIYYIVLWKVFLMLAIFAFYLIPFHLKIFFCGCVRKSMYAKNATWSWLKTSFWMYPTIENC